jgi:TolB-like protein/Tfp pilus assembly protein PilF
MKLFEELKRRNVFRVAIAYSVTAWLVVQVAGQAADSFGAPEWVMKMLIVLSILGFPVALVMAWAYELTPEGLRRESAVEDGDRNARAKATRLNQTIIIALSAALAYFAYDKFILDPRRDAALLAGAEEPAALSEITPERQEAENAEPVSIAVLPFTNLSDEEANEYFADGLSEELLNILAAIPDLHVAARTSSFSFRNRDVTISEIAETLNVSHVLEGSVRKSGDRVRITAQLVKADDGFHLWSENFDRTLDDIFKVQDEIARQVSEKLKVKLLGHTQIARDVDPEAYSLYLQGLYVFRQRGPENMPTARSLLEQSLAIDSEFGEAWGVLAAVYTEMVNFSLIPRVEGVALIRDAMDKAQQYAPNLAYVWGLDGYITKNLFWDWSSAHSKLDRAYELAPGNQVILGWRASLFASLGKIAEAVTLYEKALSLDPLRLSMHSALGLVYIKAGRFDDAIEIFEKQLRLDPDYHWAHSNKGKVWLFRGDFERALSEIQKNPDNQFKDVALAMVYSSLGREADAQILLDKLSTEFESGGFSAFIASVYGWRGEKDEAFLWLDRATESREAGIAYILGDRAFYALLDDQRWVEFLNKVGLYEYWLAMPPEYGGPPAH